MLYDATGNRADIRNDSEIYGSVPSSAAPPARSRWASGRPVGRTGNERLSDVSGDGMEVEDETVQVQMQNEQRNSIWPELS